MGVFSVATNGRQIHLVGMSIKQPCGGVSPCFPACGDPNQGWDVHGKFEPLDSSLNYSQITGFVLNESKDHGNIDFSASNDKCQTGEVGSFQKGIYHEC